MKFDEIHDAIDAFTTLLLAEKIHEYANLENRELLAHEYTLGYVKHVLAFTVMRTSETQQRVLLAQLVQREKHTRLSKRTK